MDNQRIDECASYAKEVEGGCKYEERVLANDGNFDILSLDRHRYHHRFCHGPCVDDNTYGDAGPDASRGTDSSPSSTSFVTAPPTIVSRTTDSGVMDVRLRCGMRMVRTTTRRHTRDLLPPTPSSP